MNPVTPQDPSWVAEARNLKKYRDIVEQSIPDSLGLMMNKKEPREYVQMRIDMDGWGEPEVAAFQSAYDEVRRNPDLRKQMIDTMQIKKDAEEMKDMSKMGMAGAPAIAREPLIGIKSAVSDLMSTVVRPFSSKMADKINRENTYLSQVADEAAKGDKTPDWLQSGVRGATRSIYQASALSTTGLGGYGIIGGFAATRANQAITEATDAGLTAKQKWGYVGRAAAIEGCIAGAFQLAGAGGLEKMIGGGSQLTKAGIKEVLKSTGILMLQELPEENITEILDQYNQIVSKVDPNDLTWERVGQILKDTTIQTAMAVGFTGATQGIASQEALKQRDQLVSYITAEHGLSKEAAMKVIDEASESKGSFEEALGRKLIEEATKTPEGLAAWVETNPDAAEAVASKESPSRDDFETAGLPRVSKEERAAMAEEIRIQFGEAVPLAETPGAVEIAPEAEEVAEEESKPAPETEAAPKSDSVSQEPVSEPQADLSIAEEPQKQLTEVDKAVEPAKVTDPSEVQKIKNSITEGEAILKTGMFNGKKRGKEYLDSVQRSVDRAREKIGEPPAPAPKAKIGRKGVTKKAMEPVVVQEKPPAKKIGSKGVTKKAVAKVEPAKPAAVESAKEPWLMDKKEFGLDSFYHRRTVANAQRTPEIDAYIKRSKTDASIGWISEALNDAWHGTPAKKRDAQAALKSVGIQSRAGTGTFKSGEWVGEYEYVKNLGDGKSVPPAKPAAVESTSDAEYSKAVEKKNDKTMRRLLVANNPAYKAILDVIKGDDDISNLDEEWGIRAVNESYNVGDKLPNSMVWANSEGGSSGDLKATEESSGGAATIGISNSRKLVDPEKLWWALAPSGLSNGFVEGYGDIENLYLVHGKEMSGSDDNHEVGEVVINNPVVAKKIEWDDLRSIVKNADNLVLRDEKGDVIPLSKRFVTPTAPAAPKAAETAKVKGDTITSPAGEKKAAAGTLQPAEQKKYLMAEIDKAIAVAPVLTEKQRDDLWYPLQQSASEMKDLMKRQGTSFSKSFSDSIDIENTKMSNLSDALKAEVGTITIEVPGDGEFTILNTKESLLKFIEKAEKFPVSINKTKSKGLIEKQTSVAKAPKTRPTKIDVIGKKVGLASSTDQTKKILTELHLNGETGELVATDGRRIHVALGVEGKTTVHKDGVFPDYQHAILNYAKGKLPTITKSDNVQNIDTGYMLSKLNQVNSLVKSSGNDYDVIYLYQMPNGNIDVGFIHPESGDYQSADLTLAKPLGAFSLPYLHSAFTFLRGMGNESVKMVWADAGLPFTFMGDKEYAFNMPMRLQQGDNKSIPHQFKKAPAKSVASGGKATFKGSADEALSEIDKEALKTRGESFNAGVPMKPSARIRTREDNVPDSVKADDADVETRLNAARGLNTQGKMQRVIAGVSDLWHKSTRPQASIPIVKKFAMANEGFRLLKDVPNQVQDKALRVMAAIVDPLGPKQYALYERSVLMENLVASVERGEPLRFGFKSLEDATQYRDKLRDMTSKTPEVETALSMRRKIMEGVRNDLVEHGIISEQASENWETYFRQQVLAYMSLLHTPVGRSFNKKKPGFAKARTKGVESLGVELDYNTSYLEAEAEYLTQALHEIEKEKLLRAHIDKPYNMIDKLKADAKISKVKWQSLVPENHGVWQPMPGNLWYRAHGIPEQIAEQLEASIIESATLTKDQLRDLVAIGGKREQMVLPTEIINQLNSMNKEHSSKFDAISRELMKDWKVWTLLNPKRAVSYMLRNMTGDIDPVIAAEPGILKQSGRATKELFDYYRNETFSMSDDLKQARDLGVIGSSLTAQEIPDLKDLELFNRFFSSESGNAIAKLPAAYFEKVKQYNEFREGILRYAAYLHYLDALRAGKRFNYGGAKKSSVDGLATDELKAGHLSRNLLGDYGDLTEMGFWLRSHLVPFWSWQEVNFKRYPRLIANAYKTGGAKRGFVTQTAVGIGVMARMAAMYASIWIWNRLRWPEEEENLAGYDRANPHIILGKDDDGRTMIFRNVGALGDWFEWFGINDLAVLYPQYAKGQITFMDMIREAAKSPINKIVGGIRPEVGSLYSLITGKSLFPDAFNPRTTKRDEVIPSAFGLNDEYSMLKGDPKRPGYFKRTLVGLVDYRQSALSDIYDLREKFQKSKGKDVFSDWNESEWTKVRRAASYDDKPGFDRALKRYYDSGKTSKNIVESIFRMDPLTGVPKKDRDEFTNEFLSSVDRKKLNIARRYSRDIGDKIITWLGEKVKTDPDMKSAIASKLYSTTAPGIDSENIRRMSEFIAAVKQTGISDSEILAMMESEHESKGNSVRKTDGSGGKSSYGRHVDNAKEILAGKQSPEKAAARDTGLAIYKATDKTSSPEEIAKAKEVMASMSLNEKVKSLRATMKEYGESSIDSSGKFTDAYRKRLIRLKSIK